MSLPGNRRGQAILMITVALIPMIGLVGLVTDLGYMDYLQKSAQTAADAAALAAVSRFNSTIGGSSFTCSDNGWICYNSQCDPNLTSATNPVETACLYAKQNGFYPGATSKQNVTIVANVSPTPPPTATGVNSAAWWITVRVAQAVPQLFSAVLGNSTGMISARATAAVTPGMDCVYVLDPSAPQSYYQNGSTTFTASCGIRVDSNNSNAMLGNGGATVKASSIDIVGGDSWQGEMIPSPPNTGVVSFPDPLRRMQPPSPCSATGGCEAANCKPNSKAYVVSSDTTLSPGVYCGGIWVKSGTATFSPGNYYLVGGGIGTQDSNSHVRGQNVFFYNTYDSHNAYGTINFNANSDAQLSAPDSGTYAAILVFQDRTCCLGTMPVESFQGGANSYFQGTLYLPNSQVLFAGNPIVGLNVAHYTVVVVRQFDVQGTSSMNNDFSGVTGGNPIKVVALVE